MTTSFEIKTKIETFLKGRKQNETLKLQFDKDPKGGTNRKLEEFFASNSRTLLIFRIETKQIRVEVLDKLKNYLREKNVEYNELQKDRVNELEINVEGRKKIRIEIKFDTSEKQYLKGKWYNSAIKRMYSQSEIKKMTPNDTNELMVLKKINDAIDGDPITLKIGNKTYKDVIAVLGVPGTPKADFVVVNKDKTELCWISYKAGSTAKSFQQYSGISERLNKDLFGDKEVKYFREQVVKRKNDIGKGIYMQIEDSDLKRKSIYGKGYKESKFGKDNVTFFVQGEPKISNKNGVVRLNFGTKLCRNGTLNRLTSDYEPTLGARKGSGRKIKFEGDTAFGVRGGIFTRGYMVDRGSTKLPNQNGK